MLPQHGHYGICFILYNSFFLFGCALQHAGILVPRPGVELVPPAVKTGVLTSRPPVKVIVAQSCPTLQPHQL